MSQTVEFVAGLRAVADWYEAHPKQPLPLGKFQVFVETRGDLLDAARALGIAKKHAYGAWFWISREFGGGVALDFNVARGTVCTRRVVGAKHVPASPEHMEEIVEWDCGNLLDEMPAAEEEVAL